MSGQVQARPPHAELEQAVEREIMEHTWGRIHRLRVHVNPDRLVVRGWTSSYYTKQLAIQAVLNTLGPEASLPLDVDIEVGTALPGPHA